MRMNAMTEDEFYADAVKNMFPKLAESAFMLTTGAGDGRPRPEACLQLGAAILMEKPIMVVALKGQRVPDALRRAAHTIVEVEDVHKDGKKIEAAIDAMLKHVNARPS